MPTVLVIEDQRETSALVKSILATRKIDVIAVEKAQDGIDAALVTPPDLIFMDLLLPGIDGFTAIEIIKNDETLKHIPIIAVTAASIANIHERLEQVGADAFIGKPFSVLELINLVESFLK